MEPYTLTKNILQTFVFNRVYIKHIYIYNLLVILNLVSIITQLLPKIIKVIK